ncbi:MAG: hypothetical protein AAFY48_18130 [Bacteroidota bacterium]
MAQQQWTVPGYGGRKYRVGMYHGEDSGHLMVHCNNRIMLIDFGVKDSKNYSFFLDQELFELYLMRDNGSFSYDLRHNEDVDTPHNLRREQDRKTSRWRLIAAGVVLSVFVIAGAIAWSNRPAKKQAIIDLLATGKGTTTEVSIFIADRRWQASYRAGDQVQQIPISSIHPIKGKGLKLSEGDRFAARYAPDQPELLYIDWSEPTAATLERYQRQAMVYHASKHPELSRQQVGCQVRLAYALEGMDGLGFIIAQNRKDTPKYNRNSYLRMTRSTEFRQGKKDCL